MIIPAHAPPAFDARDRWKLVDRAMWRICWTALVGHTGLYALTFNRLFIHWFTLEQLVAIAIVWGIVFSASALATRSAWIAMETFE